MSIRKTDKFCTYITRHPSGFYYIGKGRTELVLSGKYKGSGLRLFGAMALHADKYAKDTWTTTVLETFPSVIENGKDIGEVAAYNREKELVTIVTISDPFCLNDNLGGKNFRPLRLTMARLRAEKLRRSGKTKLKRKKRKTK